MASEAECHRVNARKVKPSRAFLVYIAEWLREQESKMKISATTSNYHHDDGTVESLCWTDDDGDRIPNDRERWLPLSPTHRARLEEGSSSSSVSDFVPRRDLSAYTECRLITAGNPWCAARWEVR